MRKLVIMIGVSGSGKSTYIKEHNLENWTISSDELRLQLAGKEMSVTGTWGISQKKDGIVWQTIYSVLEERFKRGEFTIFDATNVNQKTLNQLVKLAKTYKVRVYALDVTKGLDLETIKTRNRTRKETFRIVPEEVIDRQYEMYQNLVIPKSVQQIEGIEEAFEEHQDFNSYREVKIIGDIHGSISTLIRNLNLAEDTLYIFCGDYLDRGLENAETMQWFIQHKDDKNMIFLEGNHEKFLRSYVKGEKTNNQEFDTNTTHELDEANLDKKEISRFLHRLRQCAYFGYGAKTYLVTHGGVVWDTNLPLETVSTEDMVNGSGKYRDVEIVERTFNKLSKGEIIQIHGHRSLNKDTKTLQVNQSCFNLEGGVEAGGCLKVLTLSKTGTAIESCFKNELFYEKFPNETAVLVAQLRKSHFIKEYQFGDVSSFNFTKDAFQSSAWNHLTTKARGLYINTKTNEIVARAYDKFFNLDEKETLEDLKQVEQTLFPCTAYKKENGFLGIVGYDKASDHVLITSKADLEGDMAKLFEEDLRKSVRNWVALEEFLKTENCSLVFECVDVEKDLHIIDYKTTTVYLLDIIENDIEFTKRSYRDVQRLAARLGIQCKQQIGTFYTFDEFANFIKSVKAMPELEIEGYVFEFANGKMIKYKTEYYNQWKYLRGCLQFHKQPDFEKLTADQIQFYEWAKDEELDNICLMRHRWQKMQKEKEEL